MGCTASEVQVGRYNKLIANKKPSVWLIGGGPGCEKGKICQYLKRDYKFKYLSSYDIVEFQQERGGPDAELIQKLLKEKSMMPSDLIVRLIKKAIASCGIRRFLIDGFPNSIEDVDEFGKELTDKEIDFYGYLHIQISQKKMIQSGLQAHSADKSPNKEAIQANVKEIVKTYVALSEKIKNQYRKIGKYHEINGEEGADKAYQLVRQYLQQSSIKVPNAVKVFFTHFDDPTNQNIFCDVLVRKYGLYFYTLKGLINQALQKHNSYEGNIIRKLQLQSKQIPSSIILSLIRKKLQKHDYEGNFLVNGFPRRVDDSVQWEKFFDWQTQILGYLIFKISDQKLRKIFSDNIIKSKPNIKLEEIVKQYDRYQNNQSQICDWHKKKEKLLKIDSEDQKKALQSIKQFFEAKNIYSRLKLSNAKLAFLSTLNGSGDQYAEMLKNKGATIISMQKLISQNIQKNGLYSELIESFVKIGKPLSGIIAARILLEKLMSDKTSKAFLIQGFPNSVEQLQSWEQQIGQTLQLSIIIMLSSQPKYIQESIKQKVKQKKIIAQEKDVIELIKDHSQKLQERIKKSSRKYFIINSIKDSQLKTEFLKQANFN